MADQGKFNVAISATDSATNVFKKLNAQISAMQKPAKSLNREMGRFADLTGISAVSKGFVSLGGVAVSAAGSVAKLGLETAGIAGIGSIAGVAAMTVKWAEWGNQIEKTADWLGVVPQKVLGMQNMSKMLGADANSLAETYENVSDMQRNARLGLDPKAMQLFGNFKITTDPKQTALAINQIFNAARQIQQEGDPAKLRAFFDAFHVSPDLIRAVTTTSDTFEQFQAKANAAASEMAPFAAAADKANIAFNQLGVEIKGVLADALTPYADELSTWLSKSENQKTILDDVKWAVNGVKTAMSEAKPEVTKLWKEFEEGDGWFGKTKTAFEAIAAVSLAAWAASAIASLGSVTAFMAANPVIAGLLAAGLASQAIPRLLDSGAHELLGLPEGNQKGKNHGGWDGLSNLNPFNWGWTDGSKQNRAASSKQLKELQQGAFDTLLKTGIDQIGAKAMIANFTRESSMNPRAVDATGHTGLGQWDAERQADFRQQFGYDMLDPKVDNTKVMRDELQFAVNELHGSQSKRAGRFNAATTLQEATAAYNEDIERSAESSEKRQAIAGGLTVVVRHENPPPGVSVSAKTSGAAFAGATPSVATSMHTGGIATW
jgi:hypothetical protein